MEAVFSESLNQSVAAAGCDSALATVGDSVLFAAVMEVVKEDGHMSALEAFAHPLCLVLVLDRVHVHNGCHCSVVALPYPEGEA
jgi:hypothetical protein